MKRLHNGDLLYGNKEDHPDNILGYTRDSSNPHLYHLEYLPCIYRSFHTKRLPCGKIRYYEICELFKCLVSRLTCAQCQSRKES